MNELHLDLRQNATRQYLYDSLLAKLDTGQLDEEGGFSFPSSAGSEGARIDGQGIGEILEAAAVPERHHHDLPDVLLTIDGLPVSDRVKNDMRGIYTILAEAEAQVHGCAVDHTHFHEVGNASSIQSSLGICLAIEALDPNRITATPVQVGSGKVQCSHGILDIPAPATAAILSTGVPICSERLEGERCTPTAAAVIKHFVDEFL